MQLNLLIVEDDQLLSQSLKAIIPSDFKVYVASRADLIPDHVFFHAAFVDMHLQTLPEDGKADGPVVISLLIKKNPSIDIISMSGDLNRDNMHAAIKAGAQKFLAKPLNPEEVLLLLEKIIAYWQLRNNIGHKTTQTVLIGQSDTTEQLRKSIALLKGEAQPVLIEGETGTGKDVVARCLNEQEGLRPFISVNCSSIPDSLFESEFFGHLKGSFTGADQNKTGYIEAAQGGDLFLDEIEALPLNQQAKLLRFLENGEFIKVGDKKPQKAQVRVICASNEILTEKIKDKTFREDLYYRLSSHKIYIKPLRDRLQDIKDLSLFFLDKERPRRNKTLSPEALLEMSMYQWPGNVRELKRVCEQLVLLSPLPIIEKSDVTKLLSFKNSFESGSLDKNTTLKNYLETAEKDFFSYHIKNTKNIDELSETLQISKSHLYKKIKDHGLTL